MAGKRTSLLKLVQERALAKKETEEEKKKQLENLIPDLSRDCICNILVRLPVESVQRARFVCKPWYKMVYSSAFVDAHLSRSESVLLFLSSLASLPQENPTTFSVEAKLFQSGSVPIFHSRLDLKSKYHMQFMEIRDGKSKIGNLNLTCFGQVEASCNGLILLTNKMKKGGLVLMNPVTRNLTELPLGTLCASHNESFGLAWCNCTCQYKLVHLFRDEMQFVGCEVLNIGTRSWRVVDGPSFGLFTWFGYNPVSAIGALHWVPRVDRSDYIVSMSTANEKFHNIPLPKSSRTCDGIVEMGGLLCFVTQDEINQIDVWILRSLCGEDWTKQHTITVGCTGFMVPLYCTRVNGEMVFKCSKGSCLLYAYDFQYQTMRQVEMEKGCFPTRVCSLPHVNTLVSLQIDGKCKMEDD